MEGDGWGSWRAGWFLGLPEALVAYSGQGCSGIGGRAVPAASWAGPPQLSRALTRSRQVDPVSEAGQEPGLGSGSSWQQADFQVVAAGARWGQVRCWSMLPLQLGKEQWLRPWEEFFRDGELISFLRTSRREVA